MQNAGSHGSVQEATQEPVVVTFREIEKVLDPDPFAMLLHLSDTYYSGTAKEMKQRFLGLWPSRKGAVNRAPRHVFGRRRLFSWRPKCAISSVAL
jgi:hypothetical protein